MIKLNRIQKVIIIAGLILLAIRIADAPKDLVREKRVGEGIETHYQVNFGLLGTHLAAIVFFAAAGCLVATNWKNNN